MDGYSPTLSGCKRAIKAALDQSGVGQAISNALANDRRISQQEYWQIKAHYIDPAVFGSRGACPKGVDVSVTIDGGKPNVIVRYSNGYAQNGGYGIG